MLEHKGYIGTVESDDGAFFGRVNGLRDVITFEGDTYTDVEQAFRDSIDDDLAFCAERGEQPDRRFSGSVPLQANRGQTTFSTVARSHFDTQRRGK